MRVHDKSHAHHFLVYVVPLRKLQATKVLQLPARNFYETPQQPVRSSCDVSGVQSVASVASETGIAHRDKLANIKFSEFQVCGIF
jgi:hypothetical protein